MLSCHGYLEFSTETFFVGKQSISASEPMVPHNANGGIQAIAGTAHAVVDAGTHLATKPLGMGGTRAVRFLRLRIM